MAETGHWQWQEPGKAWKGAGLYHVTLTVTDRQPVLGRLVTPEGNPTRAQVVRTALGDALIECLMSIPRHHTEVQVLHFCLMPDHLHTVLYVRRTMAKGIRTVVRGFWQAAKKLGRVCSQPEASFIVPTFLMRVLLVVCLFSALGHTMAGSGISVVPIVWLLTQWPKKYVII